MNTFILPKMLDDENNGPITVSIIPSQSFITVSSDNLQLIIQAPLLTQIGSYSLKIQLSDLASAFK
jgi:hypothetical protein